MSSLGQLVGGVAHEINNPVNFIHANLDHLRNDIGDLLSFIQLFHQAYPDPLPILKEKAEKIDLDYLSHDVPKLLNSMETGTCRIKEVVLSLRNFSRLDESEYKSVNLHEGIDSTLLLLGSRLDRTLYRPEIEVIRQYGSLSYVECYPGQLNQVFMNLLINAIDALDERDQKRSVDENSNDRSRIWIMTEMKTPQQVCIRVIDNAQGIEETVRLRIFDPFFTTKAVGKGTGMGLSISYQIITEQHHGTIECLPSFGQGSEFVMTLPIQQSLPSL
jgi:two-component system, NtrC family, sensor kinase